MSSGRVDCKATGGKRFCFSLAIRIHRGTSLKTATARFRSRLTTLLFAACFEFAASIGSATAIESHEPAEIILRDLGNGVRALTASFNGRSGLFLFDTGWGLTAVTPVFASKIGCRPWGRLTGFRAIGERIDMQQCNAVDVSLPGVSLRAPSLGVIDLMGFLPPGSVEFAGGMGLDLFSRRPVTVQLHRGRVILETPASLRARVATAKAIPVRLVRGVEGAALTVDVGVPTAEGMAWMELDTGNTGRTMIARHVAASFGLDTASKEEQAFSIPLVPGVAVAGMARVQDLILDGDIGRDFLEHWDLTLDLVHARGWLAPAH